MAEILVWDLCACRPPLLIGGFVAARERGTWSRAPILRLHRALFFPVFLLFLRLFPPVLAPAGFMSPLQGLALYLEYIGAL
jgi:hypothetical protein